MLKSISALLTALLLAPVAALHAAADKPNIVYLLADDLGWSDLSAHPGGTIKTPNIDKLFKQGMEELHGLVCLLADSSTETVWAGGKDTKAKKIADNELFQNVQVRTVKTGEVGK